jgi:tripartite-type tricarboxylate transporter receptor subunit TctC
VPYAAGGVADFMARSVIEGVQEPLGSNVVVDNRGGAGGNIGIELLAKSPPDGYTIGLGCLGYVSNAVLQSKIRYNPVNDFTPIAMIGTSPHLVVIHPTLPVKNLKDFIALARSRPNELTYGSSGPGGGSHLSVELFQAVTNTKMTHVPYKGTALAFIDLLAGRIQFMFDFLNTSLPNVQAGKLRALAITSARRFESLPEVPTVSEAGVKGYEFGTWCGIIGPASLQPTVVEKLSSSFNRAVDSAGVKSKLAAQGIQAQVMTPQQFSAFVRNDMTRWKKLLDEGRLQLLD